MATGNTATLGLQVNTNAPAATAALNAMAAAANNAAGSAGGVQTATGAASRAIDAQIASLRTQAATFSMSAREAKLYEMASKGASQSQIASADAILKHIEAQRKQLGVSAGQNAMAAAANNAAGSASKAIDAQISSLRTQAATFSMSAREAKLYEMASKGASQSQIASADAILKHIETQRKQMGVSAGQTANAMRMVPAQMTDVVTQLAGGQNPFLIMIQQGGQLKDSFGGVGAMFKALLGMITPVGLALTVGAAAAGALAYAFLQAGRETDAFNQSLILSGNYVGKTKGDLFEMADALGKTTGAQKGSAEALALVVSSGKIAEGQMKGVAEAAVLMERATGKAYKETVEEAVKLGDDPVKASAKLNESMHYLTASTYARIVALKDSGQNDAAAALAQATYAQAVTDRANDVIATLGPAELAWKALGDAASSAWAKMVSGVLPSSIEEKISNLQARAGAYAAGRLESGSKTMGPQEAATNAELKTLTEGRAAEKKLAQMDGARAKSDQASIKAQQEINSLIDSGGTKAVQRQRELEKNAKRFSSIQVDPRNPELTAEALARKRKESDAAINERYKDPKAPKARSGQSALERMTDSINSDFENFGLSEVEKKIDRLRGVADPKKTGANAAVIAELTETLRKTQGLADAKLLSAAADEKSLTSLRETQAETTAAYQNDLETQRVYLDTKTITEETYNERVKAAREGQIASLKATSDAEIVILTEAKSKVKTVAEQITIDKQVEDSLKRAGAAIRGVQAEAGKDDLKNLKKTFDEIRAVTEEMATPLEKYTKELEKLNRLKGAGMADTTYEKAMQKAWNDYGDAVKNAGKSISSMEDLAKGVASGIQNELGTMTLAFVEGKWDDMGKSFEKTISNMLATAIQAKLSEAIFGSRPGNTGGGGLLDMLFGSSIGPKAASGGSSSSGGGLMSMIGNMFGSIFSFDGGGNTGSGSRSGGMDGKGGFIAMLHPQETVIDHTKRQAANDSGSVAVSVAPSVTVNIINNGAGVKAETSQRSDGSGGSIIDVVLSAVAKDIGSGGQVAVAMQGQYGLNRSAGARS